MATTDYQQKKYWRARDAGLSQKDAAARAGFSLKTAARMEAKRRDVAGRGSRERKSGVPDPLSPEKLTELSEAGDQRAADALRALEDFEFFRRIVLGHVSLPWQLHAAEEARADLEAPEKVLRVVNVAPGTGKTTLYTHDIPCWLIARNRAIRIGVFSVNMPLATNIAARIRTTLHRVIPLKMDDAEVAAGVAVHPFYTMAGLFGRFRPEDQTQWSRGSFQVLLLNGQQSEKREPTVQAFGRESEFTGERFDLMVPDDFQSPDEMTSIEACENTNRIWAQKVERRLEPKGALFQVQQKLGANDLSDYCVSLRKAPPDPDDPDDEAVVTGGEGEKVYRHTVYRAHHDELCERLKERHGRALHRRSDPPYDPTNPDEGGCLLDPYRVPWSELRDIRENNATLYLVQYQQESVNPAAVLVPKMWIKGGYGEFEGASYLFPGCYDRDRVLAEVPKGLTGALHSVVTADPSPTNFWAVQWWAYHPDSGQRFLLDLERRKMEAPDLLDWDASSLEFTGLLESWWLRSLDRGAQIRTVIVEQNAAQRFLLQYQHTRRWQAKRGVDVVGHDTHRNKSDRKLGVWSIRAPYRYGAVRFPMGDEISRLTTLRMTSELTTYPQSRTDDCVMAHWFLEWNLPRLFPPTVATPRRSVPGYASRRAG